MEEEKASGIEVEPQSELDQLLQNLIEEEEEAVESVTEVGTAKRRKIEEENNKWRDLKTFRWLMSSSFEKSPIIGALLYFLN